MTDRELLELAAKAGKVQGFWVDAGLNVGSNAEPVIWNPLTDDGDALRLAVKCGIHIKSGMAHWGPVTYTDYDPPRGHNGPLETHRNDPYAATRRAIVRAAAEIGRSMK